MIRLGATSTSEKPKTNGTPAYKDASKSIPERVDDLLSRMTLAEKIGEMTQLDVTLINTTGKQKDIELDVKKARYLITEHHIGSFLNGEAVSAQDWFVFMKELIRISVEETRLGIPIIYGIDHIHGATYLKDATIFPQGINLGATFNPEHAFQTGYTTAIESSCLGHRWTFAPVLDLGVNPLWPRFYETYGEDPFLASKMGEAYVKGYQNNEEFLPYKCAATGKHFLGYSDPKSGWDRTPAHLSMQQIHEFHRPSFQKAIDAGLKTIMLNSGEVNGVPVHASSEIIQTLLREQMGFEGVVVTDWDDLGKLVNFHYTAETFKEATFDAVTAGIDICMTPLHLQFNTCLMELVKEGRIPESRLDASVRRVLKLKFELGLFEHPYPDDRRFSVIGSESNRKKSLKAAQESIVLLKNKEGILPLKKECKIALFGPTANNKRNLAGGWTIAWQGGKEEQYPEDMHTVLTALKKEFPNATVEWFDEKACPDFEKASKRKINAFLKPLEGFDYIVYVGGEEPYTEFVGNIDDLSLPRAQQTAVRALSESNIPLVLVLVQGRPRLVQDIIRNVDAFIHAGLPGFEGAEALATILSGRENPSGKLPFSYPMSPNHYLPYNHKKSELYFFYPDQANQIVQGNFSTSLFPFGHGLSYTSFKYQSLTLSTRKLTNGDVLKISFSVSNSGEKAGAESVLVYISTHFGKISRPVKELKYFQKVYLNPGETSFLEIEINPEQLSYPDASGNAVLEKTSYTVEVSNMKADFRVC